MSNPTDSYQLYECPVWFDEKLREIGGVNRYDENNFIVRWGQGGQSECLYRAGGHWHPEGQPSFKGYRDLLVGGGTPSWVLMQWKAPELFGTPESYYVAMCDEETNLSDLGEYPYFGRYTVLYNMCYRAMINGKMEIEAMPLNSFVLDAIVPIIMEAKDISYETTMAAMKGLKEQEDLADLNMIEDAMRDSKVAYKGPTSYARQGCRTHYLDKRVEQMTRHMNQISANAHALGKGMSTQAETSQVAQELLRRKMQQ